MLGPQCLVFTGLMDLKCRDTASHEQTRSLLSDAVVMRLTLAAIGRGSNADLLLITFVSVILHRKSTGLGFGSDPAITKLGILGSWRPFCERASPSLGFYGDPTKAQMRKSLRCCTKIRPIIMLQGMETEANVSAHCYLAKDRY